MVVSRDKAIQALKNAFPAHSAAIEREYADSGYFRSICADFYACSRALTYWNKIISSGNIDRSEEYRDLLREIEQEVLSWLEARMDHLGSKGDGAGETES